LQIQRLSQEITRRRTMPEWLRPPKPKHDPLDDRQDQYRQPTQRQPAASYDESRLPPHLQRYHTQQRQPLSDRLQERREEFREHYGTPPPELQSCVPPPPPRPSRFPLIVLVTTLVLVIIGVVIAAINFVYVRNAGQTIQSLTMIHVEIMLVLLCILLNTILIDFKQLRRGR
jgi:hypothetical protein